MPVALSDPYTVIALKYCLRLCWANGVNMATKSNPSFTSYYPDTYHWWGNNNNKSDDRNKLASHMFHNIACNHKWIKNRRKTCSLIGICCGIGESNRCCYWKTLPHIIPSRHWLFSDNAKCFIPDKKQSTLTNRVRFVRFMNTKGHGYLGRTLGLELIQGSVFIARCQVMWNMKHFAFFSEAYTESVWIIHGF